MESGFKISSARMLNAGTYAEAASDEGWLEKAEAFMANDSEVLLIDPFSVTFVEGRVSV
jgi:hypothetical protein